MSFQPGANVYTQGFGSRPENVEVPHIDVRAPAITDINYPIGKTWVDTVGEAAYTLTGLSTSAGVTTATWVTTGSGTGAVATLTGDSGTATPSGGNIKIAGTANQIVTSASGSTVTLALTGPYTPATYTAHGVLIGEGTSSIAATAAGTTGQVLIGSTGADPAFGALGVNSGLTAHGVLIGENNSAIAATTAGATGEVLIGSTGADPAFGALGVNSGLTAHGVLIGEGNSAIAATAVGATGQTLMGSTGADPGWTGSPSFSGSVTAATTLTATLGAITATNGNVVLGTAGNKIEIATGTNASVGTSGVMSGTPGAVTVSTTASSATAKIFYCRNVTGGTMGNVSITAQDGTGFTLTSDANETSTFNWWIINA